MNQSEQVLTSVETGENVWKRVHMFSHVSTSFS